MKKFVAVICSLLLLFNFISAGLVTVSADTVCADENCSEHEHAAVTVAEADDVEASANAQLGDLDNNNAFTVSDLVLIAKQLITAAKNSTDDLKAADINGDYKTSVVDLVRFKKHLSADGAVDFTYEISDSQVTITGCTTAPEGCVTLPFEIDGCPVTKISKAAFENFDKITGILIPSSVTDIADNAFSNCSSLMNMAIPDSVCNLGKQAFFKCENISSIRLSENIKIICEGTFSNCTRLSKLLLPDNVEEIGESAFYLCSSLVELNIPEKVTVLNDDTFYGCTSLVFISLPENLKEIKCYTFYGCQKLQSISIPITVVNVGDNAFDSCVSLLSVVVPYETAFGTNVFTNCPVLVVEGLAGAGGIDAAINSGAGYELMDCGHAEFILLNAINPTCTQTGFSGDQYCVKCGKIEQAGFEVQKTAHITALQNFEAVTCTKDGYTGNTVCTVCSHVLDYGYTVECTGHYAESMPGYVAPTCTQNGLYGVFTCEKCGEDINNLTIPATDHDKYYVNQCAADCQNDGYTGDYKCMDCGEVFIKGTTISKGNHNYELSNYKVATCTSDGYTGDYICTGCGDVSSKGEAVAKKAHNLYSNNYKAATCTENGFSGDSVCLDCKATISEGKVLALLGHRSVLINYRDATCTEDGYSGDQICSVCKVFVSTGKTIEKTGHKTSLYNRKEATATESGYTGNLICDVCSTVIEKGKVIPANHQHSLITTNAKEPSCSQEGYTGDLVCTSCGYTQAGSAIEKQSHQCSQSTVDATCTTEGYVLNSCNNCDHEYKSDIVPALEHNWDEEWTVDSPATCTEDGSQHKNCSRCDELLTEVINSTGHALSEPVNVTSPTCTQSGYSGDRSCNNCDHIEYGSTVDATGHSYDATVTEPNCVAKGFTTYVCSICSDRYVDNYTDATGHTLGEPANATSPTCTESGYSGDRSCINCTHIEYGSTVEATGHSFANGSCSVCGEADTPKETTIESEHPYASNSNEEWTVSFEGASSMEITFSDDTETENSYDFINIYDAENNLIGSYSGTSLAGKTVTVDGDTVIITLTSDSGVECNGFTAKICAIYHYCSECGSKITYTVTSGATCVDAGTKTAVCDKCGTTDTVEFYDDHSYTNGMCDYCYCTCMHENTDRSDDIYEGYYYCYDCNTSICYMCGMVEFDCTCNGMGDMCPNCGMPYSECMCGSSDMCPTCFMPYSECMCTGGTEPEENW